MPFLIFGDIRKGLPNCDGMISSQTLSSFCQSVSGPSMRRASRMTVAKGGGPGGVAPGGGVLGTAATCRTGALAAAAGGLAAGVAGAAAGVVAAVLVGLSGALAAFSSVVGN